MHALDSHRIVTLKALIPLFPTACSDRSERVPLTGEMSSPKSTQYFPISSGQLIHVSPNADTSWMVDQLL